MNESFLRHSGVDYELQPAQMSPGGMMNTTPPAYPNHPPSSGGGVPNKPVYYKKRKLGISPAERFMKCSDVCLNISIVALIGILAGYMFVKGIETLYNVRDFVSDVKSLENEINPIMEACVGQIPDVTIFTLLRVIPPDGVMQEYQPYEAISEGGSKCYQFRHRDEFRRGEAKNYYFYLSQATARKNLILSPNYSGDFLQGWMRETGRDISIPSYIYFQMHRDRGLGIPHGRKTLLDTQKDAKSDYREYTSGYSEMLSPGAAYVYQQMSYRQVTLNQFNPFGLFTLFESTQTKIEFEQTGFKKFPRSYLCHMQGPEEQDTDICVYTTVIGVQIGPVIPIFSETYKIKSLFTPLVLAGGVLALYKTFRIIFFCLKDSLLLRPFVKKAKKNKEKREKHEIASHVHRILSEGE